MLYREIIAVCSEIYTKHINTPRGQNVELLNVKLAIYKDPVRTAQYHPYRAVNTLRLSYTNQSVNAV
jgi:hypothetical protein